MQMRPLRSVPDTGPTVTSHPRLISLDPHVAMAPQTRGWTQMGGPNGLGTTAWHWHLGKQTRVRAPLQLAEGILPAQPRAKLVPLCSRRVLSEHPLEPTSPAASERSALGQHQAGGYEPVRTTQNPRTQTLP